MSGVLSKSGIMSPYLTLDGWILLFQSSDPTIWDTDVDAHGSYAIKLDKAPGDTKYLMMNCGQGRPVIIPMANTSLASDGLVTDNIGWAGSNRFLWTAFHLGIYDNNTWSGTSGDIHIVPEGGRMGWGFGNGVLLNNGQYYTWGMKSIPKTTIEISVKCHDLTEQEKKYLLA